MIARPDLHVVIAPMPGRLPRALPTPGLLRWLSARHSLAAEAATLVVLYAAYEATRGFIAGDRRIAIEHAQTVASMERKLHLFAEGSLQHAASAVPGLLTLLGGAYLTLHLTITAALLLWLHQRRPLSFARIRTTFLVANALALIGFVVFPTAPPRLAGLGIVDTVSGGHVDLNKGLVSSLYNPVAAVPSLHMGYALIVGAVLVRYGSRRAVRIAGAIYPLFVLLVIVATGNHFFFDAATGAVAVALAFVLSSAVGKAQRTVVLQSADAGAPSEPAPTHLAA